MEGNKNDRIMPYLYSWETTNTTIKLGEALTSCVSCENLRWLHQFCEMIFCLWFVWHCLFWCFVCQAIFWANLVLMVVRVVLLRRCGERAWPLLPSRNLGKKLPAETEIHHWFCDHCAYINHTIVHTRLYHYAYKHHTTILCIHQPYHTAAPSDVPSHQHLTILLPSNLNPLCIKSFSCSWL